VFAGLALIAATLVGIGGWSALAPIAGAVIVPGAVKVDTNRRTVQHQEGGIVKKVLVRDGERSWASSGVADLDATPITESTRFRIASITKPIVAALVVDAVDRGEVALDDVVGDLVPDLVPDVLRPEPQVTVRQLLDHTSGIYDESNGVASQDQLEADIAALADPDLRAEAQADLAQALAGTPVIASDRLIVALSETHDRHFAPGAGSRRTLPPSVDAVFGSID
jgi:CubicO group peptidase (beta-lactamase class C family)